MRWLNVDDLKAVDPDPRLFPRFNEAMRQDFSTEIRLFLADVLLSNKSVLELLSANYTYLNERLASLYGITGVLGPQFRRVELTDPARRGLLGKSAVLLRTSYGDRTSPVLRGAVGAGKAAWARPPRRRRRAWKPISTRRKALRPPRCAPASRCTARPRAATSATA